MSDTQDNDKLTLAAKAEIHRYLWKLAAPFGITNLVAVFVGLSYIFFVLPNTATEQARAQIQNQSSKLTEKFIEASSAALLASGKAQANAEAISQRSQEIERQYKDIQGRVDLIKGTTTMQLAELVEKIKTIPDLGKNLELIAAVKSLETRLNPPQLSVPPQGYGTGPWVNVVKLANCQTGHIATGIEVTYGGTCNSQCNSDGGTIREIKVVCRPL
jgi:hypothetical protein